MSCDEVWDAVSRGSAHALYLRHFMELTSCGQGHGRALRRNRHSTARRMRVIPCAYNVMATVSGRLTRGCDGDLRSLTFSQSLL